MYDPSTRYPRSGPCPEAELLIGCARLHLDADPAECLHTLLRPDLEWTYLIDLAWQHRMISLLYWHLTTTFPEAVPGVHLDHLRDQVRSLTVRTSMLSAECLKILHLFEVHHLPAIPYKGPVLAASVYGDLAWLRQFGDLDILVPKREILRAKELLCTYGYRPIGQQFWGEDKAYLQRTGAYTYNLYHDTRQCKLELHWDITPAFRLDLDGLWERLEPVSLTGTTVRGLSPEDTLLILCVHGSDHFWGRLSMLVDIAALIRQHPGMKWDRVLERAHTFGVTRMLGLGLRLAREVLGTALPPEVLDKIEADSVVATLSGQLRQRRFGGRYGPPGGVLQWRMRERWPDKVRYGLYYVQWHLLTPHPEDQEYLPLPRLLFPLYSILRPLRLAINYGWPRIQALLQHLLSRLVGGQPRIG